MPAPLNGRSEDAKGAPALAGDGTTPRASGERAPRTVFRRARATDAVDLALETFLGEARVDMQALAAQLDVSPATLHRWFGSRAQLLDAAFERLTGRFAAAARAAATGEGDEHVCDYARQLMKAAVAFEPVRTFVAREPQLALRLLLGRERAVHRVLTEQTAQVIAENRTAGEMNVLDEHVHLIVQVATALVWATFAIGDDPQIDSAVELIRMILASSGAA
jgi:AcrR family transcriptional regulator